MRRKYQVRMRMIMPDGHYVDNPLSQSKYWTQKGADRRCRSAQNFLNSLATQAEFVIYVEKLR